jgi:carbamoyl-phosphate synthase large subunit
MKVLFTNAGRRTYLVQFALDLVHDGYPLDIHVSDCTPLSAVMHMSPSVQSHVLPPVQDDPKAHIEALLKLVERVGFDVLFPLMDFDALLLAQHRDACRNRGCTVVVSAPDVIERCNDKRLTFQFCRSTGLPTPQSWFDASSYDGPYPVLQKHIFGYGSRGIKRIESSADLSGFVAGRDMLQQLIEGDEFGLDVLNDLNGRSVAVCTKRKLLMRAGETDKAEVVEDDEVYALGRRISKIFGHVGNLDCDVMRDRDGVLYCIDFNPRFGGGYPATHLAGFNYLKALLDMVRGEKPSLPARPLPITVMKGISLHWCETGSLDVTASTGTQLPGRVKALS